AYEFFEFRTLRRGSPGGIVKVFVQNDDTVGCECGGHPRQRGMRVLDEGQHPATPGTIGNYVRKLAGVKIGRARGDVEDAALAARRFQRSEESLGLVDGHNPSRWA